MNKSFLIIFIPAVLVAAMYVYLGIYPPLRVLVGVGVAAVGLAAWGIRTWMKRGKAEAPEAESTSVAAKP